MDGGNLNAVVKKAKAQGRTVELLEYVLQATDREKEPQAYQKVTEILKKERQV